MANKLIVAPAPHVHGSESTQKIMRDVLLALTPALVFSVVAFGWSALAVTCISVASCVLFEYLIQKFLLKGPCTVSDLSAVVTGVLLAFNLPASLPWWIVVIGAFVSIAIAKMTFGGLGKNPFNPALVGRVFLLFAYPVQMTTFPRPVGQLADAFSGATPLAAVKAELVSHTSVNYQDVLSVRSPVRWVRSRPCCCWWEPSICCGEKSLRGIFRWRSWERWPCSSFWSASDRVCTVKRCGSSRCSICLQAEPFWVPFTWLPTIRLRR